jgi:hypothetical protein
MGISRDRQAGRQKDTLSRLSIRQTKNRQSVLQTVRPTDSQSCRQANRVIQTKQFVRQTDNSNFILFQIQAE